MVDVEMEAPCEEAGDVIACSNPSVASVGSFDEAATRSVSERTGSVVNTASP